MVSRGGGAASKTMFTAETPRRGEKHGQKSKPEDAEMVEARGCVSAGLSASQQLLREGRRGVPKFCPLAVPDGGPESPVSKGRNVGQGLPTAWRGSSSGMPATRAAVAPTAAAGSRQPRRAFRCGHRGRLRIGSVISTYHRVGEPKFQLHNGHWGSRLIGVSGVSQGNAD